ncbi:JAB domain-containing protein [Pseudomonas sp. NPDC089743]|uniref:JAB domain-containing protein n=1 Tax=Pseudomonas sp. NPDC089743 TaxID=3364471 RepID=UPI0037F8C2F8
MRALDADVLPSQGHKVLIRSVKELLRQVDMQVLDHIIVGSSEAYTGHRPGHWAETIRLENSGKLR